MDDFEQWVTHTRNTELVLKYAKQAGITRIAIGMKHESVPVSMKFPDHFEKISMFQHPENVKYEGLVGFVGDPWWPAIWPAIWWVAKQIDGAYSGCANGGQAQVNTKLFERGVWHLKGGEWEKVA